MILSDLTPEAQARIAELGIEVGIALRIARAVEDRGDVAGASKRAGITTTEARELAKLMGVYVHPNQAGSRVLNASTVRRVVHALKTGDETKTEMAQRFGVGPARIERIAADHGIDLLERAKRRALTNWCGNIKAPTKSCISCMRSLAPTAENFPPNPGQTLGVRCVTCAGKRDGAGARVQAKRRSRIAALVRKNGDDDAAA